MVGVDVGFENPMFACLEIDYEEADADPSGNWQIYNAFVLDSHYDYLEVRVSDWQWRQILFVWVSTT